MWTKRSKWLFIVTAVLLMASLLSACSGKSNEASPSQKSEASPSQSSGSSASNTDAKQETVTLKVEMFDRGNAPAGAGPVTNNYWTQWIQKNFGDPNHIKLEFVPVPRNQEVDKLNVLMATNDAPDIVFTYDMNTIYNYVKDGGLTDLGQLIEDNGPNLKEFLGEEVLSFGKFNGKQFTIPAKKNLRYANSSYIRKDWLDKLGLPVPTTTEEFYNTMKAFKEKDPGQTNGKVIPYGFSGINGTSIVSPKLLLMSFVKKMSEEDRSALYITGATDELGILDPGFKDGVRFLNKMNQEGLINSDFALDKDDKQFGSDLANGYIGAFTGIAAHPNLMGSGKLLDTLKKNVPGAEYVAMDAFTNEEGKTEKYLTTPIGIHIMIPKSSKHAVEAIKYLDWMSQRDVLFTLVNGIEGEHYNLENGFPVAITTDEAKKTFYNNFDIAIVINGQDFGTNEKNIEAVSLGFPDYKDLAKQTILNGLIDGVSAPRLDRPIESEIKYSKILKDKGTELVVKSILAKPDDLDKIYDAGIEEFLKLGGQAVIDERRAAYKDMKK